VGFVAELRAIHTLFEQQPPQAIPPPPLFELPRNGPLRCLQSHEAILALDIDRLHRDVRTIDVRESTGNRRYSCQWTNHGDATVVWETDKSPRSENLLHLIDAKHAKSQVGRRD
jgi:hypothetical protein